MRIRNSVPVMVLAATLATMLPACQRRENSKPDGTPALPSAGKLLVPEQRDGDVLPPRPGPRPILISA